MGYTLWYFKIRNLVLGFANLLAILTFNCLNRKEETMKLFITALFIVSLLMVGCGGGNACEDLAQEYLDKLCACDDEVSNAPCDASKKAQEEADEAEGEEAECTESQEAALQKLVDEFKCPGEE